MNIKLKTGISAALAAALVLTAAGCSPGKKNGAKTVGIAMPAKSLERWNRDGEYLKQKFEAAGYNVELRFSDNSTDQQVNDIQVLIADDVDLLIIAAIDGSTLFRTLEDAEIKNIPVIAYDRLIMNTDSVACYISFDNYSVGKMQAQFIVDELGLDDSEETYNIELVSGDSADNNAVFFYNGAVDLLAPYIDSGRLKIPSGKREFLQTSTPGWSIDLAFENMQNTLSSYYSNGTKLDAVLAVNDGTAFGAAQAILSDYTGGNTPVITGQDGEIASLRNIVDGIQSMTIYKNVTDEANVTVEVAEAILGEKPIDGSLASSLSAECVFDTESYDNGKKVVSSYLLKPEIITVGNLDYLADTGLYRWDDDHKYLIEN